MYAPFFHAPYWNGAALTAGVWISATLLYSVISKFRRETKRGQTAPIERLSIMRMLDDPYAMIYWDGDEFHRWDGKRWVRLGKIKPGGTRQKP